MDDPGRLLCKTIKNRHFYINMRLHFLFFSFLFDRKKSGFHLGAILVGGRRTRWRRLPADSERLILWQNHRNWPTGSASPRQTL